MRLCRYERNGHIEVGFYREDGVVPLPDAAVAVDASVPGVGEDLLPLLTGGVLRSEIRRIAESLGNLPSDQHEALTVPLDAVQLLVPIPRPSKLLLLAGNYSKHIEEGGGRAEERARTFPYVFMKPPLTTLTDPGRPVQIPRCSPQEIDWELELGVIIGRRCRDVPEAEALNCVAGYTIVNDISDRAFHPNPSRAARDKDAFFDWLHGKWHDTFCPMGPAVLPADEVEDPQEFQLQLRVNGQVEQDASTAEMVFPVAAIIEFLSQFVTLEPGDVISTGTPSGVGKAKGRFLKAGDVLEAEISGIGILSNPVVDEPSKD